MCEQHRIDGVIHLAGMLATVVQSDPLTGAEVNVSGSLRLLRHSIGSGVKHFVFASSMSVDASLLGGRAIKEDDPATPNDVSGAAKRTVELMGENLSRQNRIDFQALRIARVVGPGIQKTSSPWRSQIFEAAAGAAPIRLPFSPDAQLSLVHV